jgi:hypothetical protein
MAALALFLVVAGGSAFAVVAADQVNSDSIIDGQVKNRDLASDSVGPAKVIDGSLLKEDFKAGQLPQGPKGDKGDPGEQGPRGTRGFTGRTGPSDVYIAAKCHNSNDVNCGNGLTNFNNTRIATLELPAGNYLVTARVGPTSIDADPQDFTCQIFVNYNNTFTNQIDLARTRVPGFGEPPSLVLQGTVYYTDPGFAILACNTFKGGARFPVLSAVKVGNLH